MSSHHALEFAALGKKIEASWRSSGFHPNAFPEIAMSAAEGVDDVDVEGMLLAESERLDTHYRFSEFDLHIFTHERFRIEILYWVGNSTSIHQHAFSGAFKLLTGRSLHVEYAYEKHHDIHPEVSVGDLRVQRSEIMEPGAMHAIVAGPSFIHANYHMLRPTVTMVIRTLGEVSQGPQFTYRYPHFAVHPFGSQARRNRQARLLEVITRSGNRKLLERAFAELWPDPTLEETLDLLELPLVTGDPKRLARLLDRSCERHPTFAAQLVALVKADARRARAAAVRSHLVKADQKFLYSLLANLHEKESIYRHLEAEFPNEDPHACAARLIAGAGSTGHVAKVSKRTEAELAAVLAGKRAAEDVRALRPLLAEVSLQALFS